MKKANDYYILFLRCMVRTKMVVGSLGIVADTSYDRHQYGACQKLNLRRIHHYCKHKRYRCRFYVSQKLILHKRHKRTV